MSAKKYQVFVVEDDLVSLTLIKQIINSLGHKLCGTAESGSQAISLISKFNPDIVLMDISLEGTIDGIEVSRKINNIKATPVIFVTGNTDDKTLEKALTSGPYGYITKPFSKEALRISIDLAMYRHILEERIKEKEQLLSVTLKSIGDGIISLDQKGKINFINKAARKMIGISVGKAHCRPLADVMKLFNEVDNEYIDLSKDTINTIKNTSGKIGIILKNKNGSEISVDFSISEIIDEHNNNKGHIISINDTSLQHQIRKRLQQINEILERKVEERTSELAKKTESLEEEVARRMIIEKNLKKALSKEKEINELKSRLVSTISHEFRTPMTTILSSTQLLERSIKKPENQDKIQRHLKLIKNAIETMDGFLDDTLVYEKIETEKILPQAEIIDIKDFFANKIFELKNTYGKNHKIAYTEDFKVKQLFIDKKLLNQIITNILSNAIKYSEENSLVKCSVCLNEENLQFTIKDEGKGIPQKDIERIYDSFFRAGNVTNEEGTGLGLSIVKASIDLLNGEIKIKSDVNHGTSVFVKIPANIRAGKDNIIKENT